MSDQEKRIREIKTRAENATGGNWVYDDGDAEHGIAMIKWSHIATEPKGDAT